MTTLSLWNNLPSKVDIIEVGPRDGLQNESSPLSVAQRVELIRMLHNAGVHTIEAGSFVSPKWVPQMADTDLVLKEVESLPVNLPVLVPNERGLESALAANAREIAVFTASSDAFTLKNTNCTVEDSLKRIENIAKVALAQGIKVRGYVSTIVDCPYDGPQPASKTVDISKSLLDMGCYEVSLGDTIGRGTPKRIETLLNAVLGQIDADKIAVHFHDTMGQALANILVALQLGISKVDSSVGGLGGCPYAKGASGNVATEDVVYMLHGMGIETGIDLEKLIEISRHMSAVLNKQVPSRVFVAHQ